MNQVLPNKWVDREALRDKGQFWTPFWVADAMAKYISQDSNYFFDPAVGKGSFLYSLKRLNSNEFSFYGTDIDSELLNEQIFEDKNCFVECKDFIKNPPKRKFTSIIANPPYIRHHRIDNATKSILKELSFKITGRVIDGRAGYHIYFLIQALNLLEKNGRLVFIMPADTCEGTFSKYLWDWITKNYCLEAVVVFDEKATPFPNVDTNSIIFFIKNIDQMDKIHWVKCKESNSADLLDFVSSGFNSKINYESLDIFDRDIREAIKTGLSRPSQKNSTYKFQLKNFAKVMRGIATGSNEFFFLTKAQAKKNNIPEEFLRYAIGRTKDIGSDIITLSDLDDLELKNRPTQLLCVENIANISQSISDYLKLGVELGLPDRPLIKQRKPWYKMEKRKIPPILFTYLGRRSSRFIKNEAKVLPLTGFLCVYPQSNNENYINNLWKALNHPATLENLHLVGKSYGSGSIKVEPRMLDNLPIPSKVVNEYNLLKDINLLDPHKDKIPTLKFL